MEKYFTKEQIERLKDAVEYFNTAVNANYKRASQSSLNDLVADVYEQATGEKLQRNWHCGSCVLNCYRKAGQLYFESLKHLEETTQQAVQETTNQEQDTQETTVPDDTQKVQEETEVTNPEVVGSEPEPAPVKKTPAKEGHNIGAENTDNNSTRQNTKGTVGRKGKANPDKSTIANKKKTTKKK